MDSFGFASLKEDDVLDAGKDSSFLDARDGALDEVAIIMVSLSVFVTSFHLSHVFVCADSSRCCTCSDERRDIFDRTVGTAFIFLAVVTLVDQVEYVSADVVVATESSSLSSMVSTGLGECALALSPSAVSPRDAASETLLILLESRLATLLPDALTPVSPTFDNVSSRATHSPLVEAFVGLLEPPAMMALDFVDRPAELFLVSSLLLVLLPRLRSLTRHLDSLGRLALDWDDEPARPLFMVLLLPVSSSLQLWPLFSDT